MAKILTVDSRSLPPEIKKKAEKENFFKKLWESFQSLDKFTKLFIIFIILFVIAVPYIKTHYFDIRQRAQTTNSRYGFVPSGGDLATEITKLNINQYYNYGSAPGGSNVPPPTAYMIGKNLWSGTGGPLSLQVLMDGNLQNFNFDGGSISPWTVNVSSRDQGYAEIDTTQKTQDGMFATSVHIHNGTALNGTQIFQQYKQPVSTNQIIIYGAWVKTANPSAIKISLQNAAVPNDEYGATISSQQPQQITAGPVWTFVMGWGKVPQGETSFNLELRVKAANTDAWFDGAVAYVVDADSTQLQNIVKADGAGAAWFIGNEPGFESTTVMSSLGADPNKEGYIYPVSPDIYALVYKSFYTLIKRYDSTSFILPGGLAGAPCPFTGNSCGTVPYSPGSFLDAWRSSYYSFFVSQPPIDAMNIHYYENQPFGEPPAWSTARGLSAYLQQLRTYMDAIPIWNGKPIWITELGVVKAASNGGVDFVQAATNFLNSNTLNIQKWFWFDTCGFDPSIASLFVDCTVPVANLALTPLGTMYASQANIVVTPTPTPAVFVCSACKADLNKNGIVDVNDYYKAYGCSGKTASGTDWYGQPCTSADIDGNGRVDSYEVSCVQNQYFARGQCIAGPTPTPTSVSIPTPTPTSTPWYPFPTSTPIKYPTPTPTPTSSQRDLGQPKGSFDAANCTSFQGWACDPDNSYSSPVTLRFYEGSTLVASGTNGNVSRPDVNSAGFCGSNSNTGFDIPVPSSLKNGGSHTIAAKAVDVFTGIEYPLWNSTRTINACGVSIPSPTPVIPIVK